MKRIPNCILGIIGAICFVALTAVPEDGVTVSYVIYFASVLGVLVAVAREIEHRPENKRR